MVINSTNNDFVKKITQLIFALLIFITIALNILAPIFALYWSNQPFLGVFFYPGLVVSDSYNPNWEARKLGLQPGDILKSIDGQSLSSGRDIFLFLRKKQINDQVTLKVEQVAKLSNNLPDTITVTLKPFSLQDLLTFFLLPYAIGLVYFAIGFIVYRLRGVERIGGAFITFCIFVSIFTAGLFDQHTLHFLTPIWVISYPFIGASLMHIAFVFPIESPLTRRYPWLYGLPYGIALLLGMLYIYSIYFLSNPRLSLQIWFSGFSFIGIAAIILFVSLLRSRSRYATLSPLIHQQTTIILLGIAFSFGPTAIWYIANILGFNIQFSWSVFIIVFTPIIIFPLTIAYTSLRYRLLDLDILFSQAVIYTILTLFVSIAYILFISFLSSLLADTRVFQHPIILTIFIIALVFALGPVKEKAQALVNKRFLREQFDYRQMLQSYGHALISTPLTTNEVLELLVEHTNKALSPESAFVFLRNTELNAFAIRYQYGGSSKAVEVNFGLSDQLAQWLSDTNDILQITPNGIIASKNARIHREEVAMLNMLGVALCIPLLGSKRLLGWLALGLKKSGQPYASNDFLYLATMASQTTIALENSQLLGEAKRRAAELEALQKISADVQSQDQLDLLLTSVVELAAQLLHVEGGMVWLLDPNEETLRVKVSHNLDNNYVNYVIRKGEGVEGRVLTLGEAVVVDNYPTFSGRSPIFQNAQFGAVLGVPLSWSGKVRGVLSLVHRPNNLRFSEDDIWLMKLFAAQAAIALEKSRLLHETQRRANQLAMLSEVSKTISSTLNLDIVLKRVMDGAVQILNAEAGSLFLIQQDKLVFKVVLGPTGEELLGLTVPIGVGIVGKVAQTSEPLIVNDVSKDPSWHTAFDKETDFKTRDLICVPMIAHDRVIGVVEVINKLDGTSFVKDDTTLLMSFAVQAAIVIENAQLFTRTDKALAERVQELQTLQIFDQELQTSLEINNVMDTTLTRAMDALGVSIGAMGLIKEKDNTPFLYLIAQYGMPESMAQYKTEPWPLTQGIIGRVSNTKKAVLANNIAETEDYFAKTPRTQSLLVVPILRDERVIGVIDLESTELDYFNKDDINFVMLLASHASIAIHNAQLFEQVKIANEAKTEFMNTASHDLKVPMTSIKGYAKMLQMGAAGALTEQQKEFTTIIYNNVERMAHLVAELLDVSRIEAGRIRLELQDVYMSDIIDDVLSSVRNQIEDRKLELVLEVENNLPKLKADYGRLMQITTNFISNAYKYTPEGGKVTIIAKRITMADNAEGISLTVKDTGFGISKEDQAKLFTNFFRSSDQNVRNQPGTGLGLSITKKMIESHGGTLTFESDLGKGSAFTFTLPLIIKVPPGVEVTER